MEDPQESRWWSVHERLEPWESGDPWESKEPESWKPMGVECGEPWESGEPSE